MTPIVGRLKRRPDFLKVAAARTKWVTPGLILQARRRPSTPASGEPRTAAAGDSPEDLVRVGFTVSRKVGDAVRRNRARRRLRAVAGEVMAERGRPGYDYVLIGRGATVERPYAALIEDLETALANVGRTGQRRSRRGGGPHGTGRAG
jgi:ribonuclease P protein component